MGSRENFFTLLELSTTENSPEVIKKAIMDAQRNWSKLRNHPSKGRQAQLYLGLLKEIKKVMLDDTLREQERKRATAAQQSARAADRAQLEKTLSMLSAKGYISPKELEALEKMFPADAIKKALKVPVKTEDSGNDDPEMLPRLTLKKIDERLKIIRKRDLYHFLGRTPRTPLKELQKITHKRYLDNNKIASKTAQVTATSELLGFCSTIFKTEQKKRQYDFALAQLTLNKLDPMIELAGIDEIIQVEEFIHLLKEAQLLNITRETAIEYVMEFCKERGWSAEIPADVQTNVAPQQTTQKSAAPQSSASPQELLDAAKNNRCQDVEDLLAAGLSPNVTSESGNTPLMLAAYHGHFKVVKTLVQAGADLNQANGNQVVPLIWVASENHLPIARYLISNGAQINWRDDQGNSPLIWAAIKGHLNMVKLLVEHGANIEIHNKQRKTALDLASPQIKLYFNQSAGPQQRLFQAAEADDLFEIREILTMGVNLNGTNAKGETPLIIAARKGYRELAQFLLSKGASHHLRDHLGYTPLIHAIQNQDLMITTDLLKRGVDINQADKEGYTPLMHAVNGSDTVLLDFILNKKPKINERANGGNSALTLAVWQGKSDLVRRLIDLGGDPMVTTGSGKTLLDLAKERNNSSLATYLSTWIKEPEPEPIPEPVYTPEPTPAIAAEPAVTHATPAERPVATKATTKTAAKPAKKEPEKPLTPGEAFSDETIPEPPKKKSWFSRLFGG